eukprot:9468793-Pyramimonas_sp.AAC.1
MFRSSVVLGDVGSQHCCAGLWASAVVADVLALRLEVLVWEGRDGFRVGPALESEPPSGVVVVVVLAGFAAMASSLDCVEVASVIDPGPVLPVVKSVGPTSLVRSCVVADPVQVAAQQGHPAVVPAPGLAE